jgi:hypothetical protein
MTVTNQDRQHRLARLPLPIGIFGGLLPLCQIPADKTDKTRQDFKVLKCYPMKNLGVHPKIAGIYIYSWMFISPYMIYNKYGMVGSYPCHPHLKCAAG